MIFFFRRICQDPVTASAFDDSRITGPDAAPCLLPAKLARYEAREMTPERQFRRGLRH